MNWSHIQKQAREINRRKTHKGQVRQAKLYFEMVRRELQVRDLQSGESGADMDPGAPAGDAGQVAADLFARLSAGVPGQD